MYSERRNTSGNGLVIIFVLISIGAGVWYLDNRYGSTMTGYILLGLAIAAAIVIGWLLSLATMRTVLSTQSEFNRNDAMTDKYRMMAHKEFARGDTAERTAQARIGMLDAKRIDQIAQQRAGLLLDLERQKMTPKQIQKWGDVDDGDDQFTEWE